MGALVGRLGWLVCWARRDASSLAFAQSPVSSEGSSLRNHNKTVCVYQPCASTSMSTPKATAGNALTLKELASGTHARSDQVVVGLGGR